MKNLNPNTAMTENQIANSNVIENPFKSSKKNVSTQKRQAIPAMWRVLGRAQKTFDAQIVKDNAM